MSLDSHQSLHQIPDFSEKEGFYAIGIFLLLRNRKIQNLSDSFKSDRW